MSCVAWRVRALDADMALARFEVVERACDATGLLGAAEEVHQVPGGLSGERRKQLLSKGNRAGKAQCNRCLVEEQRCVGTVRSLRVTRSAGRACDSVRLRW